MCGSSSALSALMIIQSMLRRRVTGGLVVLTRLPVAVVVLID